MELYRHGISELRAGVALDIRGRGEAYERAAAIRTKMTNNLSMASDRLLVLGEGEERGIGGGAG